MNKFVVTILFLSVAFSLKAQDSTKVDPQGKPALYCYFIIIIIWQLAITISLQLETLSIA